MKDQDRLYEEIHCLAYYYHWSPGEILAQTRATRRRYLELLTRQLDRERGRGDEEWVTSQM